MIRRSPYTPSQRQFISWMNRQRKGWLNPAFHCWSWRLRGTLVTLWLTSGTVKIYHRKGRSLEHYPHHTERCRDAIHELANQ